MSRPIIDPTRGGHQAEGCQDAAVRLSDRELEAMLERAAEEGARRALSVVGPGGNGAVLTIHDMRSLGIM